MNIFDKIERGETTVTDAKNLKWFLSIALLVIFFLGLCIGSYIIASGSI